jgi:RHS repeat-associated protein
MKRCGFPITGSIIFAGGVAFSNLAAQVSMPSATDISPTVNTEVSSLIHTGCGYDAWTGSAHRSVTDLEVPGAVSSLGLKWVRTYNSGNHDNPWSFSWTWRYWGRGWAGDAIAVHLPDGGIWRRTEPGMKLRWDERDAQGNHCGLSCVSGDAYLYLEDGSKVHMDLFRDAPEPDQSPPRTYWIDYYTPTYVDDPYGRRTTLTYEQPSDSYCDACGHIRLVRVTDPSGRFIKITYANNDDSRLVAWSSVKRVEGSDGSWVNYNSYSSPDGFHFHVDYSDGTSADYTYGDTTYLTEDAICRDNCIVIAHAPKVITAQDTHADGPMQSIQYEYQPNGAFEGQIRAEHHYPSLAAVSTFTSTSCPTHSYSTSPDCPSATQTEKRGDCPSSRTIYMEQATAHVPLVKRKSDFNGLNEIFTYDPNNYLTSVKDRNGYTTTYTNESVIGNPTQILHPDGNHIDYTYSDSANPYHISTVTDELGKKTTYTRGSVGSLTNLITRIDYPDGAYETFTYNGFGQVLTHRRKNGAFDYAAYDATGLLTKLWNPTTATSVTDTDPHITLTYYPVGDAWQDRVQTVTYPKNSSGLMASEAYEYDRDSSGNAVHGRGLVTKITHADGTYKSFGYDAFGNKVWEENELRQRTTYTYDDYKRVRSVKNALLQTTSYDYTATSGASGYSHTTNSVRRITSPTGIKTAHTYDNNFRLASTIEGESTINATTRFGYDNNGNQTKVTDPRGTYLDDPNYTTTTTYDNRNRKKTVTDPYPFNYQVTTFTCDAASNVTRIDRPDTTWETKIYDAMHRVLTDTVPQIGGSSPVNLTTTFLYNPSGTLQKVTDPKLQITTFNYDASDQKKKMTYPGGTQFQSWTYDDAHNLASRTTVGGKTQSFGYDNRNRKITMRWSGTGSVPEWADFGYYDDSRLKTATNGIGTPETGIISTVFRSYDSAGRLKLDQQTITGLAAKSVNYFYNGDGNQTRMYVSGGIGYDYTFGYDGMGRFETITPTGGSVAFQYYYDTASNETKRSNVLNTADQIYTRDNLNRISRLDLKNSTGTFSYEIYGYDPMSRLISITRKDGANDSFAYYLDGELNSAQYGWAPSGATGAPASLSVGAVDSSADALVASSDPSIALSSDPTLAISSSSLTMDTSSASFDSSSPDMSVDTASATSSTQRAVTYNLDKAGNRLSVVDTGVTKTYSRNSLNQYTAAEGSTVSNGSEHEIASYQGNTYTYINDERLSSVNNGVYTLAYDALGRCVQRTLNGATTDYIYDGEKPILEYDTSGAIIGRNLYGKGTDEILMRIDVPHNWTLNYQQDHEGNVIYLTNVNGYKIAMYRYDVFGAPTFYNYQGTLVSTSPFNNRFLFTGREYASTFGFYEYRARAYHPTLGRFMSEDPKGFVLRMEYGATSSDWSLSAHPDEGEFNLFRYCYNDPLDRTDPTGEIAEVTVDGNEISIRIPIQFSGEGATEKVTGRYIAGMEKAWSGKFGQYHVTTKVDTEHGIGKHDKTNKIEIVKNPNYRSNVVNSRTGTWNNSGGKKMAGHEGGHLMGQGDRYTDVKQPDGTVRSVPNAGYEKNIMGNMSARPSAQDIKDIMRNKKVNEIIVIPQKTGP